MFLKRFITKNNIKDSSGITLVEVLIATFMLAVALTGINYVMISNVTYADSLRQNTIANGLAQEGIEIIRNIRDQEWLTSGTFGNNIPPGKYEVQWNTSSLAQIANLQYLKKDPLTGLFSYDTGADTIFTRKIVIESISAEESQVTVYIEWATRGGTKTLEAEDHLFNWY